MDKRILKKVFQHKEEFLVTHAFWKWAKRTGGHKKDWERYNELVDRASGCAFCKIFLDDFCPLYDTVNNTVVCDGNIDTCCFGIYRNWYFTFTYKNENRKPFAKQIFEMIDKWMKEVGLITEPPAVSVEGGKAVFSKQRRKPCK